MQFTFLLVMMLFGALAEVATLGAVVPFISLLARPELALEFPALQRFFLYFGWNEPTQLAAPMTVAFLVIVLVSATIRVFLIWLSKKFVYALGYDLGVQLYSNIMRQPYRFHISQNTSETIAAITKVQIVVNRVIKPLIQALVSIILSIGIVLALLFVDPLIAIVCGVGFGSIYFLAGKVFKRHLSRNSVIISSSQGKRVKAVQEGLGGIRDILLDGNQAFYIKEFSKIDYRLRNAQANNAFLGESPRYVVESLSIALIVLIAYGLSIGEGGLIEALPILAAIAIGAQRIMPLIQQIYQGWAALSGNKNVLSDVVNSLELGQNNDLVNQSKEPLHFNNNIELDNVSFRYNCSAKVSVLQNISLKISKGSKVGFVGKTGSGKSTLLDVIMGLLEPTSGVIKVDGEPLTSRNRYRWFSKVAHVPQNIYLTDGTIAENIAFGISKESIDTEKIRSVAQLAEISDYIETLPDAYETQVGERGVRLSGGQCQRIGIARALYKNAEILVLDEASSALDSSTEEAVMRNIEQYASNLTVLMIAHRLETLKHCDAVVGLEGGTISKINNYQESL